jgi:hypothetical protein
MQRSSLNALACRKPFRAKRVSSYDVTGGNADFVVMKANTTHCMAEIAGPGVISHIWFTIAGDGRDKEYLRKMVFRAYWDGEVNPSIEAPVGDFFCVGHGAVASFENALFNMSAHANGHGKNAAMNCWIAMPFRAGARLEIVNDADVDIGMYYYIDYQEHGRIEDDVLYFHAQWRRENPCKGWTGKGAVWGGPEHAVRHSGSDGKNRTGERNYLILDAVGEGHYIGCNLSVHNLYKGWWGEGDDMFFVDGEAWPPSLHGTGSEDYFSHAWGMQKNAFLYNGMSFWEWEDEFNDRGKVTVYRLHVQDPVPFSKSLRVTIEHGHANDRSDDYASVAYWYQSEPHKPFSRLPEMLARLPNP